jgi:hypothetical protein
VSWLLALWLSCQPKPLEYSVVRGDTLSRIARAHGVTVEELRAWNGLEGDLIEVDQVLLIYLEEAPDPAPEVARSSPGKKTRRASPGGRGPETEASGGLSMPSPEACVAFDADPGEEGMVAPGGLERHQVKPPLDRVLPYALECPRDDADSLRVVFELTVGCDGVVDRVVVDQHGGASDAWLDCASEVLRHADFPAHDMPDGMTFSYPVTVSW